MKASAAQESPTGGKPKTGKSKLGQPDVERFSAADLRYLNENGPAAPGRETFSIGELTREFRVTARTLRFYEERGLVTPERVGQERRYSRRDRARMRFAVLGKAVGFSLDDIREMLDLYDTDSTGKTQLVVVRERFRQQIERLKRQREAIDVAIDGLEKAAKVAEDRLQEQHNA